MTSPSEVDGEGDEGVLTVCEEIDELIPDLFNLLTLPRCLPDADFLVLPALLMDLPPGLNHHEGGESPATEKD